MKNIKQIKKELKDISVKHNVTKEVIESIKGNSLTELFKNINKYISWYRLNDEKEKEFNAIFENELIIEDGVLLCNCSELTSITIPNSVTSIGNFAFIECSKLTSIIIPNYVTSIGDYAFYNCTELTSITIPNSITSISDYAFYNCSKLTSIIIPNSVTSIRNYAFYNWSEFTSIEIPNSITSIGDDAFTYCSKNLKIIRK